MRHASKIYIQQHKNFDIVFSPLERSQSSAQEIQLTPGWDNRWGRLPVIEIYLKPRTDSGRPVEILRIGNPEKSTPDMDVDIVGLGLHQR